MTDSRGPKLVPEVEVFLQCCNSCEKAYEEFPESLFR